MKKHTNSAMTLALILILAAVAAAIFLIARMLEACFPGVWRAFAAGDADGLQSCVCGQNRLYIAGLMWLLTFVQVLSIVIPTMPVQLAAGVTLGTWPGFLISYSASIAATMSVYFVADRATGLLRSIAEEKPRIGKMLSSLSVHENRTYYTVMALLIPGLPNGLIPCAVVNSGVKAHMFLLALMIALPIPTWMTCAAGSMAASGSILGGCGMLAGLYGAVCFLYLQRNTLPVLLRKIFRKQV